VHFCLFGGHCRMLKLAMHPALLWHLCCKISSSNSGGGRQAAGNSQRSATKSHKSEETAEAAPA